jgi:hypothetical protein
VLVLILSVLAAVYGANVLAWLVLFLAGQDERVILLPGVRWMPDWIDGTWEARAREVEAAEEAARLRRLRDDGPDIERIP